MNETEDLDLMDEMDEDYVEPQPTRIVLTGAYYGRTVKLRCGGGEAIFRNGVLTLPPRSKPEYWDGVKTYLAKSYQAFEEGTKALARNQARDRKLSREYAALCEHFGQKPQVRAGMPNPFSKHAHRLRERAETEGIELGERDTQASAESRPAGQDGGDLQPAGARAGASPAGDVGGDDAGRSGDPGVRPDGTEQPRPSSPARRSRSKSAKA